jgi:GT2 family glycosyltransferase
VLVLNADLRIAPNAIRELQVALDDPAVGVAVPALTDHQGELLWSVRREPSVLRALGDALLGAHLPQRPGALGEIDRNASAYDHPHAIDWATGAALLISDACDERVGRWDDTRFFLYSEETDFAARARCEGYRVEFVPAARVEHGEGGSGRSPASGALLAINRVRYYEKHHGRLASAAFRAVVVLHELLRAVDPAHRRALRTVVYRARWAQVDAEVRSGCSSELPVSRIRQPSKHLISMSASSTPRAPTEGRRPTTPRELQ